MQHDFSTQGYTRPVRLLDRHEARRHYQALVRARHDEAPLDWQKAWAAASTAFFALASHPDILSRVSELLGDDILIWGARLVHMSPGASHEWHSDLESSAPSAKTVSVWVALKDCSRDSSLRLLPGSQLFGEAVQQIRATQSVEPAPAGPKEPRRSPLTACRGSRTGIGVPELRRNAPRLYCTA